MGSVKSPFGSHGKAVAKHGEALQAKYGRERRALDFVSRTAGRIGRRVVLEVVLSQQNIPSVIATRMSN